MSEYDYSGLYNNGGPQNNYGQPAGTQPEQPQAEQSGYPNAVSYTHLTLPTNSRV